VLKRRAAFGFRAHSGWAALTAVAEPVPAPLIVRRCRIELADRSIAGSVQPYHTAQQLPLNDAETYLQSCSSATAAMARKAVRDILAELSDYQVAGACVLLGSGRRLPSLAGILASHVLIHTAEGEFYRAALRQACECCGLPEIGMTERELAAKAAQALGRSIEDLQSIVAGFGKVVGPPWRQDERLSALAAWLVLTRRT
jgi:hypothetical protein